MFNILKKRLFILKGRFYEFISNFLADLFAWGVVLNSYKIKNFWHESTLFGYDSWFHLNGVVGENGLLTLIKNIKHKAVTPTFYVDFTELFQPAGRLLQGTGVYFAVGRRDKGRLLKSFRQNTLKESGVTGSRLPYEPFKRIGYFIGALIREGYFSDITSHEILFKQNFINPRDWIKYKDALFIISHHYLTRVDKDKHVAVYKSKLFSSPHSISVNKHGIALITSSGIDALFWFDLNTFKFVRSWYAIQNGYNLSIGREKLVILPPKISDFTIPIGYSAYFKELDEALPTARQVLHPNSAIFGIENEDIIYFTAFATKEVDAGGKCISHGGSGGKIMALLRDNSTRTIISGLANPHDIVYIGEIDEKKVYMVSESSAGTLNFYQEQDRFKWSLLGKISFDGTSKKSKKDNRWLMGFKPTVLTDGTVYLSASDHGFRQGIHVLKITPTGKECFRFFINTPKDWAIQRVLIVPSE